MSNTKNMRILPSRFINRLESTGFSLKKRILIIDTCKMKLTLLIDKKPLAVFPVSISAKGIGNKSGSFMTPPGVHKICEKIGADSPFGAIFKSRIDTKEIWNGSETGDNLILSRIIRLEGCEPGINKGPGIDSLERYIYIHGTDKESLVGIKPFSHGCICMKNQDIISLFDKTEAGDGVIIY